MKRTRRHKFLQLFAIFLLHSIIHVHSERLENNDQISSKTDHLSNDTVPIIKKPDNEHKSEKDAVDENGDKRESHTAAAEESADKNKNVSTSHKETIKDSNKHKDADNTEKHKNSSVHEDNAQKPKNESVHHKPKEVPTTTPSPPLKSPTKRNSSANVENNKSKHEPVKINGTQTKNDSMGTKLISTTASSPPAKPTWRPKRNNCTPPAIEQFPRPIMGPAFRKKGGFVFLIVVALYTFLGLAIVCDDYFVASLDRICEELKLSPDVAGATFMAAGSSAPELATVIIGVFFAKDDIGVSGVIGSAVFNIMFVISVCALCTSTVCYLNWWPLVRDCFFYAVSILIMLYAIHGDTISWDKSLVMLFMYVVYCVVLYFNPQLEKWAQTLPVPCKKPSPEEESGLVSYKTLNEEQQKHASYGLNSPDKIATTNGEGFDVANLDGPALNQPHPVAKAVDPNKQQSYYRPRDPNAPEKADPLIKPTDAGIFKIIAWATVFPIHYMCKKTMPDCKTEQYRNWYPFTFFVSMIWISFYSYFMVWMITVIGYTFEIPDTVMGLTFVAAGVSVPDALSSIAVIKEGYGDMAVSNAVGSNVFDILICLGLPWFIQTAIIKPGSHVNVISKGLTYSTLSLLSTVVFLLVATHLNGWKLDKKYGIILMIWYILFITFASLYELNVFGKLNPAECKSEF